MRSSKLVATAAAVTVTALAGGAATSAKDTLWYARLRKPRYQPPPQAVSVVRPALYADTVAGSASTIDHFRDTGLHAKALAYTAALALNLALNGSWSWMFFRQYRPRR
jgi:benzodiazapine receptor